ncbi:MAG: hypothetical protein B7X79_19300, partial [Acidovorax sp. 17-64-282]
QGLQDHGNISTVQHIHAEDTAEADDVTDDDKHASILAESCHFIGANKGRLGCQIVLLVYFGHWPHCAPLC